MYELRDAGRADERESPDIRLLLVGHGERRWLLTELAPLLDELERPGLIRDSERPAALANLAATWRAAQARAEQTERVFGELAGTRTEDPELRRSCERFHVEVRRLREAVARRVDALDRTPTAA